MEKQEMDNIYFGCVSSESVGSLIGPLTQSLSQHFGVLRSLDSNRRSTDLKRELGKRGVSASLADNLCIVKSLDDLSAARKELFYGFDELWFFDKGNREDISDLSSATILTSDSLDLTNLIPNKLRNEFIDLKCFLAIGDGVGLNFITPSEHIQGICRGNTA